MRPPSSTSGSTSPPPGGRRRPSRFTLAQVFFTALALSTVLVGVLLYVVIDRARAPVLEGADRLRDAAARHVEELVQQELALASDALDDVERRIHFGLVDPDDPEAMEAVLFGELLERPRLSEATFTRARRTGFKAFQDDLKLSPSALEPERWQRSVFRAAGGAGGIVSRSTRRTGDAFVAAERVRAAGAPFLGAPWQPATPVKDPTDHPTFVTLASKEFHGQTHWSDLQHFSLDEGRPEPEQRVVVTVQKSIEGPGDKLYGVVRIGLLVSELDAIVKTRVDERDPFDPHRIFLCDDRGRLLARVAPEDRIVLDGDDLRVVAAAPPEPIAKALESRLFTRLAEGTKDVTGAVMVSGRRHLVTFHALGGPEDWIVGIVVPEDHYTGALERMRRQSRDVYLVASVIMVVGGALALRALRRGLASVVEATARMRRFDFAPTPGGGGTFRDIDAVAESLERAKTVVRAMGKYVPMDLVRRLYESNQDPVLGGELRVVTMMFTDIEGFTSLSEKLAPDELASKLGLYLETMTDAIRATDGTIDKYIGDAVMALWNAPGEVPGHPRAACRAALACVAATRALYASDPWRGLPALTTRYGLHTDRVMVGHFGAPARLSYTALGDGVNLAARLEPLCKQYGIILMVIEAVEADAREEFELRRLDRVAVKGKTRGVMVYELLGARGEPGLPLAAARTYEKALDAYFDRRFADAIALLDPQLDDPPSKVLRARCARLLESPPPEGWDGVFVASSK